MRSSRQQLATLVLGTLLAGSASGASSVWGSSVVGQADNAGNSPSIGAAILGQDILVNADMWDTTPRILAAGLGFTGIIGVQGLTTEDPALSDTLVRLAGGTWNTIQCRADETPMLAAYTSAATPEAIATLYGGEVYHADGLPIEFSWPVLPSTVRPENFRVILNNGQAVQPDVASIWPNFEYNERSTVVIFGHFGNRTPETEPGALYPVQVEVVDGEVPLELVGPGARRFVATGLSVETGGSPYSDGLGMPAERKGPRLVGAKLSRFSTLGDSGPAALSAAVVPNHGGALYGEAAQFRLRVLTTGGMTLDGVRGLHPDEFERYFRIQAEDEGETILLETVGQDYVFSDGSRLRIEGLADLGLAGDSYSDCYQEDKDNQIDVILSGDIAAARRITRFEIPGEGRYLPLYNPGGPGNDPTPNVRYSDPSPPIVIDVMQALDDPMTVTVNYQPARGLWGPLIEKLRAGGSLRR